MTTKHNWPLHFVADDSEETLCGKSSSRVRKTRLFMNWYGAMGAEGRRCEACRPLVDALRTQMEAKP